MSEFRQNRATKEWVIIAQERGKRPSDFAKDAVPRKPAPSGSESCPFCPGHEDQTPEATFQMTHAGKWKLRAVPNRFAALSTDKPATQCDPCRRCRLQVMLSPEPGWMSWPEMAGIQ